MDKSLIYDMSNVVSTMDDDDIMEFLSNYEDELSFNIVSDLIVKTNNSELLKKYIKYVGDNLDIVIDKWDVIPNNDNENDILNEILIDQYDDVMLNELFDGFNKDFNFVSVNELLLDVMTAIGKLDNSYNKCESISILFNKIKGGIINIIGENNFNSECNELFLDYFKDILLKVEDMDIIYLSSNIDFNNKELEIVFNSIKSDEVRNFFFQDKDEEKVVDEEQLKKMVYDCLDELSNMEFTTDNISVIEFILSLIMRYCSDIYDDYFLEDVVDELYNDYGIILPYIVSYIDNDDKKIELFLKYNMAGKNNYIDVLASIQDEAKFKELYSNLDEGFVPDFDEFPDDDKMDLIYARKNQELAYKMLFTKYKEFKSKSYEIDRAIDINYINRIYDMITLVDEKDQKDIYNLFAEYALSEEKSILIGAVNDIYFKREYLNELENIYSKNVNKYVMSRKLYH